MDSDFFSENQFSALQNSLDTGSKAEYQAMCRKFGIHACYETGMGRLMLAAEMEAGVPVGKEGQDKELFRVCKRGDDLRCQVGHVLSNLKSRSKKRGTGPGLEADYAAFRRNTEATVQIVDKSWLEEIGQPNEKGKIRLKGIESRHGLDLSRFDRSGAPQKLILCDHYFYANELIPDTDIFGSGFFIDHDKVVTAAHVLVEAFKYGVSPENLMFIRGRYVYDTKTSTIEVRPNQLYLLDEPTIFVSEQMRNGDQRGDMAWVRAKPFFKRETYPFSWNGFAPALENAKTAVYALGHGLCLPMKLSFKGEVQDLTYKGTEAMFTCDMNILPGSSGSPIFDANTHRLLGIVSGLHEIYTNTVPNGDCVELITDMGGKFSGVATHIAPFSSL